MDVYWSSLALAASAVALAAACAFVVRRWKRSRRRAKWAAVGEDVIVLHGFERAKTCPNASPFVLKLETFLRVAKLDYVFDTEEAMGPKGKSPWITINGQEIADSQLIIDFLCEKFDLDVGRRDLDPSEQAVARAWQVMLDERFFWCMALDRFIFTDRNHFDLWFRYPAPRWLSHLALKLVFHGMVMRASRAHGLGRHSQAEVERLGLDDLRAVDAFIGDKKRFLMGDCVTAADCALFGIVANLLHCTDQEKNIYKLALEKQFANVMRHYHTVREQYWPDWNDVVQNSS